MSSTSSDHQQLREVSVFDSETPHHSNKSTAKKKKIVWIGLLVCGLCCLVTCLVFVVVLGVYFGRKNENVYPNPKYTSSNDFLHFLVVGDQGRADSSQKKVAASMGKFCQSVKKCHFVVGVGDNIYQFGVSHVEDSQFKTKFEDIYQVDGLEDLKWYMLLGNHDYRGNVQAQIDYTQKSHRWILPSHYYTLVKNSTLNGFNVSMVMLDTSPFVSFWTDPLMNSDYWNSQTSHKQDQLNMMEKVLLENRERNNSWTLIFGHHHVYSGGLGGNSKDMMTSVLPLLEKYQPPLYICGHVHLLNWLQNPQHKTNYIISGAGSGNIIWSVFNPFSKNVYTDPGFFSVEVQQDFIFVIALDIDGKEIFKFRIDK
ncbi:hypothetical protein C9374_001728 [Naegleria lovaniensis]|uniref:Calcineurin-like phosphoesterase domain-containing protein n=1 Tax=Naegleria lovaniensis TaxID=51637 RepID=A0AA88GWV6_NAELO|nr:uncharacterized protein C9374_001728 [Naegleria lovaniensis]KAG2387396.1 hypothetical protein C9374_001728 [Naegleria lovaniensis]